MKIIYIVSLSRSGSTILDLMLGSHPQCIGLGEIYKALNLNELSFNDEKLSNRVCSCGEETRKCKFWGPVISKLQQNLTENNLEKYNLIKTQFIKIFGNDKVLIDSSKSQFSHIKKLENNNDVYYIHLIRDIRGWLYSQRANGNRKYLRSVLYWYWSNKRKEDFFKKTENGLPSNYLALGYDELVLYPEEMMKKIADFVGLPFNPEMLTASKTGSHVLFGNTVAGDMKKRKKLQYDYRWLYYNKIKDALPLLLSPIKRMNQKVYSNLMADKSNHLFSEKRKQKIHKKIR